MGGGGTLSTVWETEQAHWVTLLLTSKQPPPAPSPTSAWLKGWVGGTPSTGGLPCDLADVPHTVLWATVLCFKCPPTKALSGTLTGVDLLLRLWAPCDHSCPPPTACRQHFSLCSLFSDNLSAIYHRNVKETSVSWRECLLTGIKTGFSQCDAVREARRVFRKFRRDGERHGSRNTVPQSAGCGNHADLRVTPHLKGKSHK